jgi:hypothetical protein
MNELQTSYNGSANLYAVLRAQDGTAWTGTAIETYDDAHWATYAVALTSLGGDLYGADMPSDLPVGNYRAFYYIRAGGSAATSDLLRNSEAFRWNGTITSVSSGGAAWTYSSEARFNLWNQQTATDIQDFGDSAVLQGAGDRGDAYIDSGLAGMGFTVPLANMNTRTETLLEDVSNHAARWQLADAQQWNVTQGGKPDDATKAVLRDKKYVDDFLAKVAKTPAMIVADGIPSSGPTSGALSVSVKGPTIYPGTGRVRPASITVPALPTPWNW